MFNKIRRNIFLVALIVFIILIIFLIYKKDDIFFWTKTQTLWSEEISQKSWTSKDIYNNILTYRLWSADITNRQNLLKSYCDSLFGADWTDIVDEDFVKRFNPLWTVNFNLSQWFIDNNWTDTKFLYSPKKSLFVYFICSSFEDAWYEFDEKINDYIQAWVDIESIWWLWDSMWCDFDWNMASCKFSALMPELFATIINDYSNLKLINIFWWIGDNKDYEQMIKEFSNRNYGSWTLCGSQDNFYLNPEKIDDDKNNFCSHPKTYKLLNDYIKDFNALKKDMKVLNPESFDGSCYKGSNTLDQDLLGCAFSQEQSSWIEFKNLVYNELLYYQMFMTHYTYRLTKDPRLNESYSYLEDFSTAFTQGNYEEIYVIKKEKLLAKKSTDYMFKSLRNIYSMFSIHIWMMAYYEDILEFRKNFVKLYTPLHQLRYKFKNQQDQTR